MKGLLYNIAIMWIEKNVYFVFMLWNLSFSLVIFTCSLAYVFYFYFNFFFPYAFKFNFFHFSFHVVFLFHAQAIQFERIVYTVHVQEFTDWAQGIQKYNNHIQNVHRVHLNVFICSLLSLEQKWHVEHILSTQWRHTRSSYVLVPYIYIYLYTKQLRLCCFLDFLHSFD